MMSRNDWAMLAVIGMSAFTSGGLTFLASQRMAEVHHDPAPQVMRVEVGLERGMEGGVFFAPLRPSVRTPFVIGPGGEIVTAPMQLKKPGETPFQFQKRDRTLRLFRNAVPMRFRSGESTVYILVPRDQVDAGGGETRSR